MVKKKPDGPPLFFGFPSDKALQELTARFPQADAEGILTILLLKRIGRELEGSSESFFGRHGLSRGRFSLLMYLLREARPLSPSELATSAGVTRATITGLLDGLETDGLIRRLEDPNDRRGTHIRLTPKGERLLEKVLPEHFTRMSTIVSRVSRADRKQLNALLTKIKDGLEGIDR